MKIQINIADNQVWIAADDRELVAQHARFGLHEKVFAPNGESWWIRKIVQRPINGLWHNEYIVKNTVFVEDNHLLMRMTHRISERNMLRVNPRPMPDDIFDLLPIQKRFIGAFNPHIVLPYSEDDLDV